MAKIYLFLAESHEEVEALTVVDIARRAGLDLETVSITGNKAVKGSHGIVHNADKLFEEINPDDADMLVLPGGMPGTLNLEAYGPLMEALKKFVAQDKYIAAICAAPTVFGRAGFLQGKKACCYPNMEGDLKGAKVSYDKVSVDGKIITSRGLGTAIEFALTIVKTFKGEAAANEMAAKIVYEA